ncbi:MAG: dihydroorotate dehydrogenase [Planctomycetes bacterium]|nr:dihydroorotate dehydrogenase [Planctomycetota bacterium]
MTAPSAPPPAASVSMAVRIGSLELRNPILTASGTYGLGYEFARLADLSKIGGVVGKTVTMTPRIGNPPPRTFETAGGMLNSIGLMNPGWDGFVRDTLPRIRELPCPFILNVAGKSEDEFVELTRRAGELVGIAALELNLSCPNVAGGLDFSAKPELTERIVARCRAVYPLPIFAKLSPNVGDIVAIAQAAERGGADALSCVNTYLGTAIDWRRAKTIFPRGIAGLSGPAIKPMALLATMRVAAAVKIPVVGIGGIAKADDVLEYLVAGATAVQIGTACFWDPGHPVRLAADVETAVRTAGICDVQTLIGTVQPSPAPAANPAPAPGSCNVGGTNPR